MPVVGCAGLSGRPGSVRSNDYAEASRPQTQGKRAVSRIRTWRRHDHDTASNCVCSRLKSDCKSTAADTDRQPARHADDHAQHDFACRSRRMASSQQATVCSWKGPPRCHGSRAGPATGDLACVVDIHAPACRESETQQSAAIISSITVHGVSDQSGNSAEQCTISNLFMTVVCRPVRVQQRRRSGGSASRSSASRLRDS